MSFPDPSLAPKFVPNNQWPLSIVEALNQQDVQEILTPKTPPKLFCGILEFQAPIQQYSASLLKVPQMLGIF